MFLGGRLADVSQDTPTAHAPRSFKSVGEVGVLEKESEAVGGFLAFEGRAATQLAATFHFGGGILQRREHEAQRLAFRRGHGHGADSRQCLPLKVYRDPCFPRFQRNRPHAVRRLDLIQRFREGLLKVCRRVAQHWRNGCLLAPCGHLLQRSPCVIICDERWIAGYNPIRSNWTYRLSRMIRWTLVHAVAVLWPRWRSWCPYSPVNDFSFSALRHEYRKKNEGSNSRCSH